MEKLLKKVNEYCLGATTEDVIAAIDDLVENYETPKVDPTLKPLQALAKIKKFDEKFYDDKEWREEHFAIIETALKELEEYKSIIKDFGLENPHNLIDNLNIINDSNFHKKLKALEIIKNKKVNCYMFWACDNLESYNEEVVIKLTQEEYNLLKEILK